MPSREAKTPREARTSREARTPREPRTPRGAKTPHEGKTSRGARASGRDGRAGEAPQRTTGHFVYGVVPADVTPTEAAEGLGNPAAAVSTVRQGRIAALVSEVPLDAALGQPEDLVAYQRLLDGTAGTAPVLPVRFGTVLADQESVERLLADNHDAFLAALNELDDRVEFIIRGRYVERALLEQILEDVPEAARLRDAVRGQPEESTMDARVRLGELVNQAVEAARADDTANVTAALETLTVSAVERQPTHEQDAVHVAVLVDNARRRKFEKAVDAIVQRWRGRVDMRLLGPLAPYDFAAVPAVD